MTTHEVPAPRALLTYDEYRDEVLALVSPTPRTERVDLRDALGRVLAEDLASPIDVPPFANSAMDGYAVRWDDLAEGGETRLVVRGDVPAGSRWDPPVAPGECVRVMTGAPVPSLTDSVVPVELTDGGLTEVIIRERPDRGRGAHVRGAGEDVSRGAQVAAAGDRVEPGVVSALAGIGIGEVEVRARPVVALATTGDELAAPGTALERGQIYESNGPTLAAQLATLGAEVLRREPICDEVDAFVAALDEMTERADLIIVTGGVSVGAYDVARIALQEHAAATFRHVRIQPGKPQGWARWRGQTPVLALPGNPVSAAISFTLFGRPMVERLLGSHRTDTLTTAIADGTWRSPSGRRQFVPVSLRTDADGRLLAAPTHRRGSASHMVTSLAGADALAEIPEETTEVAARDLIQIRSLT